MAFFAPGTIVTRFQQQCAHLSQMHEVSFVLVHAWSCGAESGTEARRAAVRTTVAPRGHLA